MAIFNSYVSHYQRVNLPGYPQCPKSKKFKQIPGQDHIVVMPRLIDPQQTQPSLVFKQTHTHTIIKGFTPYNVYVRRYLFIIGRQNIDSFNSFLWGRPAQGAFAW